MFKKITFEYIKMDNVSKEKRSEVMRCIKSKQTKPELVVRKLLFSKGYRYRVNVIGLPGTPDIVFSKRKKIIFVHGCFWHQHQNCKISKLPKSNTGYWLPKLENNVLRDARHIASLRNLGWDVMIVWECQLNNLERLTVEAIDFLGGKISE